MARLSGGARLKIVLVVLLCLVLVAGAWGVLRTGPFFVPFWNTSMLGSHNWTSGDTSIDAARVTSLSVECFAGKVTVREHEGPAVEVRQVTNNGASLSEDQKVHWALEGGTLYVASERPVPHFLPFSGAYQVEVLLPKRMAQQLDDVKAYVHSGELQASGLGCFQLTASVASGELVLKGVAADTLAFDLASGTIKASGMTAETLDLDLASGEAEVAGSLKAIHTDAASGSIRLVSSVAPTSMSINTVSGSCLIAIPENKGFTAQVSKVSGRFVCDFETVRKGDDTYVHGDGHADYRFDMASGSVELQKG
ncbi:MAG: DUF4097 domain-containing protein [Coriobacteriales bacterium]|jgi:DUF4097 and DUF4098 domain-containing protein YvlB|nr:DUF4097 domain-containing protein [Coriobacteriales bacterium]